MSRDHKNYICLTGSRRRIRVRLATIHYSSINNLFNPNPLKVLHWCIIRLQYSKICAMFESGLCSIIMLRRVLVPQCEALKCMIAWTWRLILCDRKGECLLPSRVLQYPILIVPRKIETGRQQVWMGRRDCCHNLYKTRFPHWSMGSQCYTELPLKDKKYGSSAGSHATHILRSRPCTLYSVIRFLQKLIQII